MEKVPDSVALSEVVLEAEGVAVMDEVTDVLDVTRRVALRVTLLLCWSVAVFVREVVKDGVLVAALFEELTLPDHEIDSDCE